MIFILMIKKNNIFKNNYFFLWLIMNVKFLFLYNVNKIGKKLVF